MNEGGVDVSRLSVSFSFRSFSIYHTYFGLGDILHDYYRKPVNNGTRLRDNDEKQANEGSADVSRLGV
jgi:hypothetical protein